MTFIKNIALLVVLVGALYFVNTFFESDLVKKYGGIAIFCSVAVTWIWFVGKGAMLGAKAVKDVTAQKYNETYKKYPSCAERIKKDAVLCKHCGSKVES